MVNRVPADKLAWVPQEGMRSALDQYQEVATALSANWEVYSERKASFAAENMARWARNRALITDPTELERLLRADTQRLIDHVATLTEADLEANVEMPWGEHRVADTVTYHTWNMAYHEGQIAYLLQLLGINPMG